MRVVDSLEITDVIDKFDHFGELIAAEGLSNEGLQLWCVWVVGLRRMGGWMKK